MPMPKRLRHFLLAIGWLLLASSLHPSGFLLSVFHPWETRVYDWLATRGVPSWPTASIVLIDFDDETQRRLGWPIPRRAVAEVIEAAAPHAKLIGLDFLLSEPRSAQEDARMVAALAKAGNVVIAEQLPQGTLPAARPLEPFRQAAFDVGFANLPLDHDGTLRRTFLILAEGGELHESFALRLAADLLEAPLEPGAQGHVHRLGKNSIYADPREPNTIWLRFYGPEAMFPRVPAWQVLEGARDVSLTADIVLIGQSNTAARDLHPTPFFSFPPAGQQPRLMAGMEVQATAVTNLLAGETIRIFPRMRVALVDLLLIGLVLALFTFARPLLALLASLGCVALLVAATAWAFSTHDLWLPIAHTLLLAGVTATGAWGYRYAQERRTRRQLMGFFERYVSPQVAREIWQKRDQIALAGERRHATVLFSDIRGFTELTYQQPSTEVMRWLNEYFSTLVPVIQQHNGFLNKFMGDGLMAVFGVPISRGEPEDARDAVRAALAMLAALEELNQQRVESGMPPLQIGIGIHSGFLTAGTIGAVDRSEYSVVGETVNLASRVETACRQLQKSLLVTEATTRLLGDYFVTRPAGTATLKGFAEPVSLYTVEVPGGRAEVNP